MRAIHICCLLFGVLLSSGTEELITTGDPIIDRLVSINATESEKKTVFIQLKALISVAPTTIFKNDVDGVIKEGSLFQIADDIGGVPGLKAIDTLMNTYKKSENKENFLDFLRNCWNFMNNQEIPEYSKWSFLEEVVKKMSEGYDMEGVRKLLIEKVLEVPDELFKALMEKSPVPIVTTITPTTTTVTSTTTPTTTPTTTTDSFEESSSTAMKVTRRSGSVLLPPGMHLLRNPAPIPTTTTDSFEEPSSTKMEVARYKREVRPFPTQGPPPDLASTTMSTPDSFEEPSSTTMEVSTERTENPTVPDSRNYNEATTIGIETATGTADKETISTTTEASTTPAPPDPYFLNLIKYFDDNPILNDVLKDLLWDVEHSQTTRHNFVWDANTVLSFIFHTRDDGHVRSESDQFTPISMFEYFDECFKKYENFDLLFESLTKFRNFDFGPLVKIIKEFNELDDGKHFFVTKLESVAKQQNLEPVSTRAYVFFNAYLQLRKTTEYVEEIAHEFIPELQEKSSRGAEILVDALKKYRKFDADSKKMAEWLTSYEIDNYECLKVWKNKESSSDQMQELIELLELVDYELGGRSCFWTIKIRTIAPSLIITESSLSTDNISTKDLNSRIVEINDYLNETPLLKYEVLVDILHRADAQDFLDLAKDVLIQRPPNFQQFDEYFKLTPQFAWFFELLVEFKEFDFKIVSILIEKIKKLNRSEMDDIIKTAKHYQDGPKYLTFTSFIYRVWYNLHEPVSLLRQMQNTLIPLLKNTTATTFQALSNSLKIWKTLDEETKKMAEDMRSEIEYKGCLKIWKRKNESDQMRNMLNMIKMSDVELNGNSCLWKNKIVTPATIELDKYFDKYPILADGLLGVFNYRKYYLQKYGEDFFTSAKSFFADVPINRDYVNFGWNPSLLSVHFDSYFSHFPEFDSFIDSLTGFRDIDLTPLVKIIKKITALNHDKKAAFIEKLEKGSPFLGFFEGYSNISPTTDYIERLKYDIIPHLSNMSPKIMVDALKQWKVLGEGKSFFRRVSEANITDDECLDIWNKKNSSKEMLEMVEMMELMDSELRTGSCFWRLKIRNINVNDLTKHWESEEVLREGSLNSILEYAHIPEFVERIKNLLMAYHKVKNSQTLEEAKGLKLIEYLDKYLELERSYYLSRIVYLRNLNFSTVEYLHDTFFEAQRGGYKQQFVDQFKEHKGIHVFFERIRSSKYNYWLIFLKDWLIPELQKSSQESLDNLRRTINYWARQTNIKKDLFKEIISGNVDVLRECGLNIVKEVVSMYILLDHIKELGFKSERIDYCFSYTHDVYEGRVSGPPAPDCIHFPEDENC